MLAQDTRPFLPNTEFVTKDGHKIATLKGLEAIFENTVVVVLSLAGIVFFIILLIGGFKFITAGGEAPKVESARKTITYAIMGLVFIVLSYLFLRFISEFTGIDLGNFRITQ